MTAIKRNQGFTLVELIAVLLIVGILATFAISRSIPSTTFQLQGSRDQLVSAFFSAQQLAMSQRSAIRLITSSSQIDIRADSNFDGTFATSESVSADGVSYPVAIGANQTLSVNNFDINRYGRTSAGVISLSKNGTTIVLNISAAGHVSY